MHQMVTSIFSKILTEGINNDDNDTPLGHSV